MPASEFCGFPHPHSAHLTAGRGQCPGLEGSELPPGLQRQPETTSPVEERIPAPEPLDIDEVLGAERKIAGTQSVGEDKYSPTVWGGEAYEDLHLPSGQLCLAKRAGVQGLLQAGIIHDIDPLMGFVKEHEERVRKGGSSEDSTRQMMDLLKQDDKMESLFHMLDRVVCHVVVKPHVEMAPNDVTRRVRGVVYTDTVDLQDKMFIMNWTVGGAQELAGFREKFEELVGGVQPEPEDGNSTE